MNVDAILLSRYAEVNDGALTVVGTFNQIRASSLPARIPTLALSLIIHAHHSEEGSRHKLRIDLINEKREPQHHLEMQFDLPEASAVIHPVVPLRQVVVSRILAPEFKEHGAYAFEVYIDETYHASTSLVVMPAQ